MPTSDCSTMPRKGTSSSDMARVAARVDGIGGELEAQRQRRADQRRGVLVDAEHLVAQRAVEPQLRGERRAGVEAGFPVRVGAVAGSQVQRHEAVLADAARRRAVLAQAEAQADRK